MRQINVLMSTYNGQRYLCEQVDSIDNQTIDDVNLLVRDDGSSDGTHDVLNDYQKKGVLRWYTGENLRPANSFWDLLKNSEDSDFYAFCDQDDVWMDDKLKVATEVLRNYPSNEPAMYFSAKRLVDAELNVIKDTNENPLMTLEEAFIYNPVTGCTLVMNKALRDIIISAGITSIPSLHDSWVYRTCLAIGGHVYYDPEPHILYRQHGGNVVGHVGMFGRFKAFCESIEKTGGSRSKVAKMILDNYQQYLTDDSRKLLEKLANYRNSFRYKISLLFDPKMRTRSKMGAFTFRLYLLLNKY